MELKKTVIHDLKNTKPADYERKQTQSLLSVQFSDPTSLLHPYIRITDIRSKILNVYTNKLIQ